jgi:hypothetical protein
MHCCSAWVEQKATQRTESQKSRSRHPQPGTAYIRFMLANVAKAAYFGSMIVTAAELANKSKSILHRVVHGGEVVQVQRRRRTVAVIQPRAGATRSEFLRVLHGRGFSAQDSNELKAAMDAASAVIGYAGRD